MALAPVNLAIFEKLQGLWMARAIQVAVRLGLPDLLADHPKGLQMLVVHGGRERTKDEFVSLLRGSSYKLQRVIATPAPISIVEALPG